MTTKEYLRQAYRLDHKINSDIDEVGKLRNMISNLSSMRLGDRVQTSRGYEAPFARCIDKIVDLERQIDSEIDTYVDLKEEIRAVIDAVANADERMVLRYRYINNYTWEQIGVELGADSRTIRRWHGKALAHVVLPKNPTVIEKTPEMSVDVHPADVV